VLVGVLRAAAPIPGAACGGPLVHALRDVLAWRCAVAAPAPGRAAFEMVAS
jgi:hypothetical protein